MLSRCNHPRPAGAGAAQSGAYPLAGARAGVAHHHQALAASDPLRQAGGQGGRSLAPCTSMSFSDESTISQISASALVVFATKLAFTAVHRDAGTSSSRTSPSGASFLVRVGKPRGGDRRVRLEARQGRRHASGARTRQGVRRERRTWPRNARRRAGEQCGTCTRARALHLQIRVAPGGLGCTRTTAYPAQTA